MHVTAILLAAGRGRRLKSPVSKPLVRLNNFPIFEFSLKILERHPLITEIILVVNSGNYREVADRVRKSGYRKVRSLVLGGLRRQDSVFNALKNTDAKTRMVLIHDSARPFFKPREITALITRARRTGAAILGVPVKATVKECSPARIVKKTLERKNLWEIQTPQVFSRDLIFKAYRRFGRGDVTDDAGLIEKLHKRVVLIKGSYDNIKITTPEDLFIARTILQKKD